MKGLLIKDVRMMASQKSFLAIGIIVAFSLFVTTESPTFLIGYVSFLFPLFTISTISYDEYGNGYAFLFSMPVTRKEYVLEKYIYGLLMGGAAWLCAVVITTIYQFVTVPDFCMGDWILSAVYMISFIVLPMAVMVPLIFKFGNEKTRIVLGAFSGALVGIVFLWNRLFDESLENENIDVEFLIGPIALLGILLAVVAVILLLSIFISIRVMEKKEF